MSVKQSTSQTFTCRIVAQGAWGQNFRNWDDLVSLLRGGEFEDDGMKGPKPEIIPANERRRAPLPVRLAVDSSWQATQSSPYDPDELRCVFVSSLGDTQLTDYMCRALAGESKMLSPTKFHNSVHNAAAGYWTISTGCMKAANSIAGYEESVSLTLLEAMTQVCSENQPVLLTFYDAPVSPVLKCLLKNEQPFAFSMVLAPQKDVKADNHNGQSIEMELLEHRVEWPELNVPSLQACYADNPTAKVLSLLSSIVMVQAKTGETSSVDMPLSEQTSIRLTVS